MNTLSSLLNWIGNTIGANPNTLTTTSKKIVGAINELDADIDAVDDKVDNSLARQTITVAAESTSTGELGSITCTRCGNIVTISVSVRNAASVASGANVYQGRLSSNLPRPYSYISGGAYYGQHAIIGGLSTDRAIIARNASSTPVTIGGTNFVTMSFTYITQD